MAEQQRGEKRRRRRHLTPVEKYPVWLELVTGSRARSVRSRTSGVWTARGWCTRQDREAVGPERTRGVPSWAAWQDPRGGRARGCPVRDRTAPGGGDRAGRGVAPVPGEDRWDFPPARSPHERINPSGYARVWTTRTGSLPARHRLRGVQPPPTVGSSNEQSITALATDGSAHRPDPGVAPHLTVEVRTGA